MKLKLDQIIIDAGTQSRPEINQTIVTEYTDLVMNKVVFPPITVFTDGIKYYLADGFHRYHAHKRALVNEIEVEVKTGTIRDALQYAFGANDKHGFRPTNKCKRHMVMLALQDLEWSLLSNRELAKVCNVSHTFVASIKEKIDAESKPKASKESNPVDTSTKGESKPKQAEKVDTEFDENDELDALLVHQKELEEENAKLKDQIAVGVMDAPPEAKKQAEETIKELRERVRLLEMEVESLKTSRDSYMKQNAEMQKQLNWYKNKLKKLESV